MRVVLRAIAVAAVASFALSSPQNVVSAAQAPADLPWMNPNLPPEQRAGLLIAQMTLEQKVQQLSNDVRPLRDSDNRPPGCRFERIARYIHGIPELGVPSVRMTNGGTGLRGGSCLPQPEATAVPSASAVGAAFNRDVGRQLGHVLGNEARLWGHQVLLGPLANMVRHPYGGRNFDFPGEDPYLTGVMTVETVKGIQAEGVHSIPKHIVGNEQETDRNNGNSAIPPRALHELYLLPFEMAAKEGEMAGIMCAYNQLNGVSACSDRELLTTTLREQWGWQGYVITDRRALHDLASSIKAGVDWELAHETPHYYSLDPQRGNSRQGPSEGIGTALQNGSITIADLDQMLRRRYVQMFKFGHFDTNFDAMYEATPDFITHGLVAREIAEQGIVLLKNENALLPLSTANVQSVALIGATWFAGMAKMAPLSLNAENANVDAPYTVTPREGIENVLRWLGSPATVTYESAAGVGTRAGINRAVDLARRSDIVIVMVGDNPYESCDLLPGLPIVPPADKNVCASTAERLPEDEVDPTTPTDNSQGTDQEALMQALTADPTIARKMVVVLKTQGSLLMPWLDKVPALVEAWYPGQEDGNAVANVLFGLRNPSGKLPMTFGTSEREAAYSTPAQFPGVRERAPPWAEGEVSSPQYTEDLQVGYRWYQANNVTPVFPFGFGLSYTTFAYSGLSVTPSANPQTGQPVLTVTYTITNTGSRAGAEASQVYLTLPAEARQPAKRLVGFQKVDLLPGASQPVSVVIDAAASNHPLSYWAPLQDAPVPGWSQGQWRTPSGAYTVHVGTSSADTPLVATVPIAADGPPPEGGPTRVLDLIWRNTETGDVAVSSLTGFGPALRTVVSAAVPADWQIVGASDVNGDGTTELLWRNLQTGDVATWDVRGGVATNTVVLAAGVPLEWQLVAPADVDGNGQNDLVWRHAGTGDVAVWLMNAGAVTHTAVVVPGALEWAVVQAVDLTGDGKSDLVVRHRETGDVAVWTMDGAARVSTQVLAAGLPREWTVVGGGDADGDGRGDLFLRHTTTGDLAVWLMSGDGTAAAPLVPSGVTLASITLDWQIAGTRDVNGDGKTDLLWRHTRNGDFAVWLLNGTAVQQYLKLAPGVPLEWEVATGATRRPN